MKNENFQSKIEMHLNPNLDYFFINRLVGWSLKLVQITIVRSVRSIVSFADCSKDRSCQLKFERAIISFKINFIFESLRLGWLVKLIRPLELYNQLST
jgi:hypothetical protein